MPIYPDATHEAEIDVKNSRFIAEILPITDEQQLRIRQRELKANHPKASHVCYGFRLVNAQGQTMEGFSDDGEPGGTSGPPILKVMQHRDLINCAILITRYFGGIKLGTGGLQRAYGDATNEVIRAAGTDNFHNWKPTTTLTVSCGFENEASLRRTLAEVGVDLVRENYLPDGPELTVSATNEALETLKRQPLARFLIFNSCST
ncbi:IMPACT family protein [Thalassolituus maritimus]|uniref:Impact N-terminal domain-containing protein n=1 Tax=Thalassolituus maritimus TaxID=484498 RepID=A0ABQ0A1E7_9GAMM